MQWIAAYICMVFIVGFFWFRSNPLLITACCLLVLMGVILF